MGWRCGCRADAVRVPERWRWRWRPRAVSVRVPGRTVPLGGAAPALQARRDAAPAAAPAPHKGKESLGGNGRCISGRGFQHGRAPRMFLTAVAQAAEGWPAGSALHFLKQALSLMMGLKLGLKAFSAGFKESTKIILS